MRELILNHGSLPSPDVASAVDWLKDLTVGMMGLVSQGVCERAVRSTLPLGEAFCLTGVSFTDVAMAMRAQGGRDEFLFVMRLNTKVPLLSQLTPQIKDRFLRCGDKMLPGRDGDPLVLCAISGGIAVGFPSQDDWDKDRLDVFFEEILPNGQVQETSEIIDNLTRSRHSRVIGDRHRSLLLFNLAELRDGDAVWNARGQVFPSLTFGLDVERQLENLDPGLLSTVCYRLSDLNQTAKDWQVVGSNSPPWRVKVTDENSSVKNNARLRAARRFRSCDGSPELYYLHARYGSAGRIHMRVNRDNFQIEVGYIGPHLPLP